MNGRKNELPPKKKTYFLKEGEGAGRSDSLYRTHRPRYSFYFIATLTVGILAVLLIAFGVGDKSEDASPFSRLERLAYSIISNDLMDLSGMSDSSSDADENFYNSILDMINGIMIPSKDPDDSDSVVVPEDNTPEPPGSLYDFDYSKVPEGETPIIPMDLSLSSYGSEYIYNSTGLEPNVKALLNSKLELTSAPTISATPSSPLVLIVHTHGTESYSKEGATSFLDNGSEIARSENISENVVSVGAVIAETLNENGISAIHCTIMHDKTQYKDSYIRAEQTIKEYLAKYPSIKLVIDVHRDSVLKSTGELVRPVTLAKNVPTAQVMCVVGSDWGGESCPSWQKNLSLALKLRESLNSKYENLCRPTYLRPSTYNQDLAPYSLLLEIGASGNSLSEAKKAAKLVAEELVLLISNV